MGSGSAREAVTTKLVAPPFEVYPGRSWEGAAGALFAPGGGITPAPHLVQVLGGPGTGKTSLLVDLAVAELARGGVDPESVLLLCHSRDASRRVSAEVSARLFAAGADGRAIRQPLVRTVHGYAYSVLRLQAARVGNPPPKLLSGAEQDTVVRELLEIHAEKGAPLWPERLRPSVGMRGFARDVRDFLMRATERGLAAEDLISLGRTHRRPEWTAVGRFAREYEQLMLLRGAVGLQSPEASAPALDAAELVGATLDAFGADPDLLESERGRVRVLLVDDAQHLDPLAAAMVRVLARGSRAAIVAGDPDQAVFTWRGADPGFLEGLAGRGAASRIVLTRSHRLGEGAAGIAVRIAGRLPGVNEARGFEAGHVGDSARVRVFASPSGESAAVADFLRRAHILDGIPWSRMAVVVRSVPRLLLPMRRTMQAMGIPVVTASADTTLSRQRVVDALLGIVSAAVGALDEEEATALVCGPIGRADPSDLGRLRRGLRRCEIASGGDRGGAELLRAAVVAEGDDHDELVAGLTEREIRPVARVRGVLSATREAHTAGGSPEDVLWAAWNATGLSPVLDAMSAAGGAAGAQADRDLDAVLSLFGAAADYTDNVPRAGLEGFVGHIRAQEIPGRDRPRDTEPPEAVTILSAHSAVGREWDVVAVPGVQEGLWPSTGVRGGVLGTQELVDLLRDGVGEGEGTPTVSAVAPIIAEERRLLMVACTRARRRLLVTAVEASGGDEELVASRFLDGLGAGAGDEGAGDPGADPAPVVAPEPETGTQRVLALPDLVAELRSEVCAPEPVDAEGRARRAEAARCLARLAEAGVPGAHPDSWYGLAAESTDAPLWGADLHDGDSAAGQAPVRLGPSGIESLLACPLRWLLERHGGRDGGASPALTGTLVHTLAQAHAGSVPAEVVDESLTRVWPEIDHLAPWYGEQQLTRVRGMLEALRAWEERTRGDLTLIDVEIPVEVVLEAAEADPEVPWSDVPVRLVGRIDRLERTPDGDVVVVDVKTGSTAPSAEAVRENAQLAAYQVALRGDSAHGPAGAGRVVGGRLVYVAKPAARTGATERRQGEFDEPMRRGWELRIHAAAASTRGPGFRACAGSACSHCPVVTSCPIKDRGRQVTG